LGDDLKEKVYATMLKTHLAKLGQWCRIENVVGIGIPDVNFFFRGKDIWIEIKIVKGKRAIFETSQITWFTKRVREGGDALVFARKDQEMWIIRASELLPHVQYSVKPHVNIEILHRFGALYTKKPFDWEAIKDVLKSY
jgi:hypothetical protein